MRNRSTNGMTKNHWLINSVIRHVALQARGPALHLTKVMIEQIPQHISAGMPVEMALRESLLLAIHSARIRVQHCVGSERHALDDFISACLEMETLTERLLSV